MWEIWLLAVLIALGFGVAIGMARKYKIRTVQTNQGSVDVEALAAAVAKAVAQEVISKMPKGGYSKGIDPEDAEIQMDESIIPVAVEAAVEASNLEGMAKEEKAVDKDLEKSKAKLAGILKKKGNK